MILRNWIVYLIAVISLAVFSVLYIKHSGFVVFMMALLVPVLYSLVCYFVDRRSVKVRFEQQVLSASKKKQIQIPIIVESKSELNRGSTVLIDLVLHRGLGVREKRIQRKMRIKSDWETILFDYLPENSGMNEIRIEKVRVINGFSLLAARVQTDSSVTFLVMPEYREYPIDSDTIYNENEGESERYSMTKPGNDPSEFYDIRQYRPGDKLNRINWKFSAKNNTLMVQDYGFPIACDTAVFVDISSQGDPDKAERALEILYFLSVKFVLAKRAFYVIWKDFHEKCVKRKMVLKNDDIYDLFTELFQSDMGKFEECIEDIYSVQYEGEFLAGSIFIYTGKKEMEDEVLRTKLRTDSLELVHV